MKCRYGEWECPYWEEAHSGCNRKLCPEWQAYNLIANALYGFTKKSWEIWFDMENKIGEECAKVVKGMSDDNLPVAQLHYLDF